MNRIRSETKPPPDIGDLPEPLDKRRVWRYRIYCVESYDKDPRECDNDGGNQGYHGTLAAAMADLETRLSEGEDDFVAVYYLDGWKKWTPGWRDTDGDWQPGEWECEDGSIDIDSVCVRRKTPRPS